MVTEKMQGFGRRALGLTFGTTMTTSSVPVALGAASQKVSDRLASENIAIYAPNGCEIRGRFGEIFLI